MRIRSCLVGLSLLGGPVLAEEVTLLCTFDQRCQPNQPCKPDDLGLRITYDTRGGEATLTNDIGSQTALIHPGPGAISFIETLGDGLVRLTTVQAAGRAVQTTHRIIRGLLYPNQYLGRCEPLR